MAKPIKLMEGLWTFPIILPQNPLKYVNCYVVRCEDKGRNLLIDTGFNRPECRNDLLQGISDLSLSPDNTDIFITHLHTDHIGNAGYLSELGYNIIMGELDYKLYLQSENSSYDYFINKLISLGMDKSKIEMVYSSAGSEMGSSGVFEAITVKDGDILKYGKFNFECIMTPGHTPGHMCLYDRESKTMFLGDHVLFDITPNISNLDGAENPLGDYLDSLKKIASYDVEYAFPAHRAITGASLNARIYELLTHSYSRIHEALQTINSHDGINCYNLAEKITWRIHVKDWESFPLLQKIFALGETGAVADYLLHCGKIYAQNRDGVFIYHSTSTAN